jgi:mevalonate kinase
LADSSKGKRADATGKLINAFAGAHGLAGLPGNRSAAKRRQVTAPFDRIVKAIAKELDAQGNAPRLGLLLDWNQELLRRSDVSSEGIEAVIAVAKGAGALGAKLTGAGGRGGSVLVLARKQDEGRIRARLKARGYPAYRVRLSHRGACGA